MEPIDRVEIKLDKVLDKLSEHGELLARHTVLHEKNTDDLDEHIKRTNLLEARIDKQEVSIASKLEEALLPIRSVRWLVKIGAGILTLIAVYNLLGI